MNITEDREDEALGQAETILGSSKGTEALQAICTWLRKDFPHYSWVGVYLVDGPDLYLAAWDGEQATEHTKIPIAKGICGMAAREGRTVTVDDVSASAEYLACFLDTRSEIVVPIKDGETVLGEIDIDGKKQRAYDASDAQFLEALAFQLIDASKAVLTLPPWRASPIGRRSS